MSKWCCYLKWTFMTHLFKYVQIRFSTTSNGLFIFICLCSLILIGDTGQPRQLRVLSTDKDLIKIGWEKPDKIENENIYGYLIKYRPVNIKYRNQTYAVVKTSKFKDSGEFILQQLRPFTKYEILVQACLNESCTSSAGPYAKIEATTDETGMR
ncbi:unnamed protein product [Didymodactylos carnosus]|uniref:Fibronectin type-III domain-containing protein n=1 Tax=Didymodactylos carnosus TaxID=1234261 RepID=A0A815AN64_9BILA|nr:unnamed protein product [Didymodactylos carnosus]CAF1256784.1 unnamed protein product [Didymodactylos carnosus]CAF3859153.1 unnamed protein product [Didymodactylos carnosus]CAF4030693.1 unnamed protein product [Didymodactylos carnosus]